MARRRQMLQDVMKGGVARQRVIDDSADFVFSTQASLMTCLCMRWKLQMHDLTTTGGSVPVCLVAFGACCSV